jgi:iron-sulfur cluster repair protein YtfE (RIC family)
LSEELRFLTRQHPRDGWAGHARLGALASFWLQRHQAFRELDEILRIGSQDALDRQHEPERLRRWLRQHLHMLLWQLQEHHQVEDHHYFPVFRRLEPRLVAGFELLERDHETLHQRLAEIAERANAVLIPGQPSGVFRGALERCIDSQRTLGHSLLRHLDDEEDLVIPLLLERGEDALRGA